MSRCWQCSAHICSFTLDITIGLGDSSCVLCFRPQVAACLSLYLPLCFCLCLFSCLWACSGCRSMLGLCVGQAGSPRSRDSLEQPSFLIPWWDNSELLSSGPLLSPRRMEPQLPTMITHSLMPLCWLSFLPWLTSLLPDYASRNIFPNTVLAPKSLSLDTRTSTGIQTHMAWILFFGVYNY